MLMVQADKPYERQPIIPIVFSPGAPASPPSGNSSNSDGRDYAESNLPVNITAATAANKTLDHAAMAADVAMNPGASEHAAADAANSSSNQHSKSSAAQDNELKDAVNAPGKTCL